MIDVSFCEEFASAQRPVKRMALDVLLHCATADAETRSNLVQCKKLIHQAYLLLGERVANVDLTIGGLFDVRLRSSRISSIAGVIMVLAAATRGPQVDRCYWGAAFWDGYDGDVGNLDVLSIAS